MELVRVKPRRVFKVYIDNEEDADITPYMDEELENLKNFINCLLTGQDSSGFSKLKLQEFVRECVAYGKSEFLLKELDRLFENLVTQMLMKVDDIPFRNDLNNELNKVALQCFDGLDDDLPDHYYLLSKFEICWCNIRLAVSEVIKVCDPLESNSSKTRSGFALLDKIIGHFLNDRNRRRGLYDDLELGLLALVKRYRLGKPVNYCQLHNVVEMLDCLEIFEPFEQKLLEETANYYRQLFSDQMKMYTLSECYRHFSTSIESEKNSCNNYLSEKSTLSLINVVKRELLYDNCEKLVDSGYMKLLLMNGDFDSIILLNSLYLNTRFNKLLFDNIFVASKEICKEIISPRLVVKDYELCHEFLLDLYNYHDKMDSYLRPIMRSSEYNKRSDDFWSSLLNEDDETIEYVTLSLAKHADELFIKCTPGLLEKRLNFIILMFRHLSNKSYFEMCYRNLLSVRLFYNKYLDRVHYNTISLLRHDSGSHYVCKLKDVIDFYEKSNYLMKEFRESLMDVDVEISKPEVDKESGGDSVSLKDPLVPTNDLLRLLDESQFSVILVSLDSWMFKNVRIHPYQYNNDEFEGAEVIENKEMETSEVKKPPELEGNIINEQGSLNYYIGLQNYYSDFYLSKSKKKSLVFLPHLGSVELEVTFKERRYLLEVSVFQAYCLLLFESYKSVNLDIMKRTLDSEYNEANVRKHLSLMVNENYSFLKFKDPSLTFDTCSEYDYFDLDLGFHYDYDVLCLRPMREDLFKVDVNYVNTSRSFEDMIPFIESTIVRYLKQTMEASVVAIFKMFSKNPKITLTREQFNKVIDSLVSREFIQFNTTNKEFLQYIP